MAASAALATMPWFANVSPLDNLFLKGKTAPAWQNGGEWRRHQGKNPLGNVIFGKRERKAAEKSTEWRQIWRVWRFIRLGISDVG